jgi:hypothetical protein
MRLERSQYGFNAVVVQRYIEFASKMNFVLAKRKKLFLVSHSGALRTFVFKSILNTVSSFLNILYLGVPGSSCLRGFTIIECVDLNVLCVIIYGKDIRIFQV